MVLIKKKEENGTRRWLVLSLACIASCWESGKKAKHLRLYDKE